uniref:Uncharacterized protein n=1 Tax=Triticum urartu TaxID=4572 RepID=A0A8R7URL0_TRIUA
MSRFSSWSLGSGEEENGSVVTG